MDGETALIVGNAIIWAAVIVAVAFVLQGTAYTSQVFVILGGGAAASIVIVGGGLRRLQQPAE